MKEPYDIIKTIRLTEKATLLTEKGNQYVFKVDTHANKTEIRHAVEKVFGTKVVRVNTANFQGKKKRVRRMEYGRRPHWKKAIVTLKEGEKIELV